MIVREIMKKARGVTIVLNAYFLYYEYDHKTARWASKEDNCKRLLGRIPKPVLEKILAQVSK